MDRSKGLLIAGLCLISFLAYCDSFGMGLPMDGAKLVGDPRVHIVNADTLKLILSQQYWWPAPVGGVYRPVTTASFLLNYAILGNGKNPAGYHVLNFLLHTANALLLFALLRIVFQREGPAFFAAALWAVHPITTESVTNVAGRADLLAAMSVLGGLLVYDRLLKADGSRVLWLALALFAIATAGVFSKENAVVLAGIMLLWDVTFAGRGWREGIRQRAAAYSAIGLSLLLLWWVRRVITASVPWPEYPFIDNAISAASFWDARFTAFKVVGFNLLLLVWPARLAADRAYNEIPISSPHDPAACAALAVVAVILGTVVARRRSDPVIFWSAGFFAIALFPTSNLAMSIGSIMAERFLYLPSLGLAAAAVALVFRLRNPRAAPILLGVVIACGAARTLARNLDWKDDLTLASADVVTAPGNFRFHHILGEQWYEQDVHRSIDQAISEGEKAWAILSPLPPDRSYQQTPAELGLYYLAKAELVGASSPDARVWNEKALTVLLRAREISRVLEKAFDDAQVAHGKPPTMRVAFQPVYRNLALAYSRLQRYPEAVEAYRYGIELNPSTALMYERLASVYQRMGDPASEAITLEEGLAVTGLTPATMAELQRIYGKDSCAFRNDDGSQGLNLNCPIVHRDMCQAWMNLAKHYEAGRLDPGAKTFRQTAQQNRCGNSN